MALWSTTSEERNVLATIAAGCPSAVAAKPHLLRLVAVALADCPNKKEFKPHRIESLSLFRASAARFVFSLTIAPAADFVASSLVSPWAFEHLVLPCAALRLRLWGVYGAHANAIRKGFPARTVASRCGLCGGAACIADAAGIGHWETVARRAAGSRGCLPQLAEVASATTIQYARDVANELVRCGNNTINKCGPYSKNGPCVFLAPIASIVPLLLTYCRSLEADLCEKKGDSSSSPFVWDPSHVTAYVLDAIVDLAETKKKDDEAEDHRVRLLERNKSSRWEVER